MYRAFIITIPERANALRLVTDELVKRGIPYKLYMDWKHKGHWWNQGRMFLDICWNDPKCNVITATDDIIFKDGWLDRLDRVLNESDYDVISLLTNQNTSADTDNDLGIRKARYRMWMYDQAMCWRQGILNMDFWNNLIKYSQSPDRTKKENGHLDCMMSAYLFDSGYKCCTLRPNAVSLQNIKSSIGHNIVIKDN